VEKRTGEKNYVSKQEKGSASKSPFEGSSKPREKADDSDDPSSCFCQRERREKRDSWPQRRGKGERDSEKSARCNNEEVSHHS